MPNWSNRYTTTVNSEPKRLATRSMKGASTSVLSQLSRKLAWLAGRYPSRSRPPTVELHDQADLEGKLEAYLTNTSPLTACSFCLGDSGPTFKHEQLNSVGLQQWIEEDNCLDIEHVRKSLLRVAPGKRKLRKRNAVTQFTIGI